MKVLHVIPSVSPLRGGPSAAVIAMARALGESGVDARIVTTTDDGPDLLNVGTERWIDYRGVSTYFFPRFSPPLRAIREFAYAPGFAAWAERQFREFDVIHVHALFSYLSTRAMMVCRTLGKPFIVRPLGLLEDWSLRQSAFRKRLFLRLVEGANLRAAAAVHFTSESERDRSPLGARGNHFIVPLGVEQPATRPDRQPARRKFGIQDDECALLFLSRWHAKKRIEILIAALAGVASHKWVLILAGRGDPVYERGIRDAVERAGMGDRVRFPGFLVGDERESAFGAADAFVLPSHSENFGMAVAEAMIRGVPPVISNAVALAPDVRAADAGWIVEDVERDLSGVLESVVNGPAERLRRGQAAMRVAASRYCWAACARSLGAEYEKIVQAEVAG